MPYTFRQGDLPKLDLQIDRGSDFSTWKVQWDSYLSLSGLDNEDAAKQVQALTLCFTQETLTIVENLGLSEEKWKSISPIIATVRHYIEGHINESVERRNFSHRIQQPGETFNDFLVSLRELVKTYNFRLETCTQKNIRDQIIEGYWMVTQWKLSCRKITSPWPQQLANARPKKPPRSRKQA